MNDWRRSPGAGKYAREEYERRFFVTAAAPISESAVLIEDRYIDGTSLRLRSLTVDGEATYKLTQKVRVVPDDPAAVSITKSRSAAVVDATRFVIDVFAGDLAGLRLAEVEVDDLAATLPQPPWLGREVTHDDRFSGGRLARTTAPQLAALLDRIP